MDSLAPLLEDLPLEEKDIISDLPSSLLSPKPDSPTPFLGSDNNSFAPPPPPTPTTTAANVISHITEFPLEIQINILTYLRAYDLAAVHQTCHYYHEPSLVHGIVLHAAERVYPSDLTSGFEDQPVMSTTSSGTASSGASNVKGAALVKKGKKKEPPTAATTQATTIPADPIYYTFEHLRNMELLVVVRILSRPEPPSEDPNNGPSGTAAGCGYYYVSKSWCKTALKWLEWQQERQQQYAKEAAALATSHHKKSKSNKISKKQQRLRQRKYSDASPPWPNVNSDIVCCHDQLQMCSNRKSARARRKVLDKQAWKCLKKLYPESSPLEAVKGECLQCLLETETEKKTQQQREQQLKEERKAPLSQPVLRRFYTRTRGVPVHCLKDTAVAAAGMSSSGYTIGAAIDTKEDLEDKKMSAKPSSTICIEEPSSSTTTTTKTTPTKFGRCPLVPGKYYAVPRAWCHAWRKYMKTGEGTGQLLPPDASALLCDAHRLSLLPPHLESYLYGESPQLWLSKKQLLDEEMDDESSSSVACLSPSPVARRSVPVVGLSPGLPDFGAADFGFLSPAELAQQQRALMTLERQREQQREREAALQQQQEEAGAAAAGGRRSSFTAGEQLDRENYCCVEILAHDELEALQNLWPRGTSIFRMSFQVLPNQEVAFSTQPCRECDASGKANFCKIPKNSKAHLRAAHQARVRIYKEQKSNTGGSGNNNGNGAGVNAKLQLEY